MPRILLIADVPWVVNDVRASLSPPGYELIETTEPRTAAEAAREHDVDAVVVDLQVGSMGGMAVTHEVRSRFGAAGAASPPVVIMLDRSADGFLAKRAGADGWLLKPFTARDLREVIANAMESTAVSRPEAATPMGEPGPDPTAVGAG